MKGRFLTAEWRKLIMANYEIDPSLLVKYLPVKTELDTWNNNYYVSLVGFMFKDVKVKGIKIPFHVDFPEVNLRFYVRYKEKEEWKRGVVFIREIVPKPAITIVANMLFHERYMTLPMKYSWKTDNNIMRIGYSWKRAGRWNKLEVTAAIVPTPLVNDSMEEFITEHFWGYSLINKKSTGEYKVDHPRWDIYNIHEYFVDCDFGKLYGNEFGFLQKQKPASVFMAEGSAISVFQKKVL
jgi:uncharacterized protein YqjF (DUF2071 family)